MPHKIEDEGKGTDVQNGKGSGLHGLVSEWLDSPVVVRVGPFFIFVVLTCLQESFGEAGRYWIYFGKTLVGAWLIWMLRSRIAEMRWAFSWEAVVVGVVIFAVWVGLGGVYYGKGPDQPAEFWAPFKCFGEGSLAAWFFILVRIFGSALVVPPLEEVFYRSYLYRNIANSEDFQKISLTFFAWIPFLVTSGVFGLVHPFWLAGILCGLAYQWLVIRKGRLGDAMTAHAITNFLLGVWVVWRGDWKFW